MCGIAGVLHAVNWQPSEYDVTSMLKRLKHRGRSDLQVASLPYGSIGCCRLAIKTDGGDQPTTNETKEVFAVFNGEIYNDDELRNELLAKGHAINGTSDSELIPHLFEEYPTTFGNRIHGMYAICVFDSRSNEAVLLRDPVGIKPLFFAQTSTGIAFASEQKALVPLPNASITEVLPGQLIRIRDGLINERSSPSKVWDAEFTLVVDENQQAKSLRIALENAVKRQVPKEWPLAVLCSGGIDSIALTYLASQCHGEVTAYVIGSPNCTDVRAAKYACGQMNVPLREVTIREDDLERIIPEVIYHTESFEPNVVRNSLLSYVLFERIQQDGFRVAFCGEGADELLHGYADFAFPETDEARDQLMRGLLDDLYRTQLQRVDRTSMAFSVETRVPYLDPLVISAACSIPASAKWQAVLGRPLSKIPLRRAFSKDQIPTESIFRQKETFSYGAGMGDVTMKNGALETYAKRVLHEQEAEKVKRDYAHIDIDTSTYERILYLKTFQQFFSIPSQYQPPKVATFEVSCMPA